MKKNRIALFVFLGLAVVAAGLWLSRSSSTLKGELRDFAFADTAAVNKIFLADKEGRTALLTRNSDQSWTVNGKFQARQDAINNLLYTIKAIEVRSPVGKNLYNNTMKIMAAQSVKIEIYAKDELVKTYYVGHPTMDNLGTFMYIEGSTVPFITHIPGFNGFLTTRYFASAAEWRDKTFLRLQPQRITELTLTDNSRPQRTFSIVRQADSAYTVYAGAPLQELKPVDANRVRYYLTGFRMLSFERLDYDQPPARKDSILKAGPFAVFNVKTDDGKQNVLRCYRKPVPADPNSQVDSTGKPRPFDMDKFYGVFNQDTSLMICQYFPFDKVFRDPQGFIPGKVVKPGVNRFE
jgi:hypothetical protein